MNYQTPNVELVVSAPLVHPDMAKDKIERRLLSLKECCEYTGWGQTKMREILTRKDSTFTIRMGNRLYVDKYLFDEYLTKCAKYQLPV